MSDKHACGGNCDGSCGCGGKQAARLAELRQMRLAKKVPSRLAELRQMRLAKVPSKSESMGKLNELRKKHGNGTKAYYAAVLKELNAGNMAPAAVVGGGYKDGKKVAIKWLEEQMKNAKTASGPKLDKDQLAEVKGEMVQNGVPVRFMRNGASLDIVTGETVKKGANVMHQIVYWSFTKATANKIAKWLGVKAAFSG